MTREESNFLQIISILFPFIYYLRHNYSSIFHSVNYEKKIQADKNTKEKGKGEIL